jgi:hypothetical protein
VYSFSCLLLQRVERRRKGYSHGMGLLLLRRAGARPQHRRSSRIAQFIPSAPLAHVPRLPHGTTYAPATLQRFCTPDKQPPTSPTHAKPPLPSRRPCGVRDQKVALMAGRPASLKTNQSTSFARDSARRSATRVEPGAAGARLWGARRHVRAKTPHQERRRGAGCARERAAEVGGLREDLNPRRPPRKRRQQLKSSLRADVVGSH